MNEQVRQVLAELERAGQEHDARETEHGRKMLNLEPDTARLLSIFVQSGQRRHLLEIGTSNGYSAIWLAQATQPFAGHVTSVDISADKQALADANLKRAGLRHLVTLIQGDALEIIGSLEGIFDLVFLDANRLQYPALLPQLLSRLAPGALILADNVHSHPQEVAGYLEAINALPDFDHVVVGVGKGLSIAHKRAI